MKITRRQLKQIIKEALEQVDYDNPNQSWGANDQENREEFQGSMMDLDDHLATQRQGSLYDIQVQLAAQAATLDPPVYNHPDQFKAMAEELMKAMKSGRMQVDGIDDLLGRIDTGYLDEDIEDYAQNSGLRDGESLDDLPPWDSEADEWYESRRVWDQEALDEGAEDYKIKISRKQLKQIIEANLLNELVPGAIDPIDSRMVAVDAEDAPKYDIATNTAKQVGAAGGPLKIIIPVIAEVLIGLTPAGIAIDVKDIIAAMREIKKSGGDEGKMNASFAAIGLLPGAGDYFKGIWKAIKGTPAAEIKTAVGHSIKKAEKSGDIVRSQGRIPDGYKRSNPGRQAGDFIIAPGAKNVRSSYKLDASRFPMMGEMAANIARRANEYLRAMPGTNKVRQNFNSMGRLGYDDILDMASTAKLAKSVSTANIQKVTSAFKAIGDDGLRSALKMNTANRMRTNKRLGAKFAPDLNIDAKAAEIGDEMYNFLVDIRRASQ